MIRSGGLINLSRRDLCQRAGIPDGSFPHVMGCTFSEFVEELRGENIEQAAHAVLKTRANPALRSDTILDAAMMVARGTCYTKVTRTQVAEKAGVSMGLVSNYFGTMTQLKTAIMRRAVKQGDLVIIAQGLASKDAHACKASDELKAAAASLLANY